LSVGGESENNVAPIRVLALCKTPDAIRSTITFLARRGVQITTVSTVQELLEKLSQRLVDFIFLSATFPHQKLDTIPALLHQSFGIESVAFAEKWDRRSEALISQMKMKHVIYGPLTGPSVLLKVRQLVKLAAEERAKAAAKENATDNLFEQFLSGEAPREKKAAPSTVVFKNKPATGTDNVAFRSSHAKPDEIAKLMKILTAEAAENSAEADSANAAPPDHKLFVAKGPPPKMLAYIPNATAKDRGLSVFKQDPRIQTASKKVLIESTPTEAPAKEEVQPAAKIIPFPSSHGAPLKRVPESIAQNPKVMVLWESARRAVLDVTQATEVFDTAISRIHSLALLSINAESVKGCFLLTAGKGRSFPYGAIADLQQRFLFHLFEAGQYVKDGDCEVIEIDVSNLPDGAFIDSDFSLTALSDVAELSISFLDVAPTNPEINRSAIDDFSRIQVKDIATGVPLTFDAYIYMPLNRKTLKYLKEGGVLGLKQKSKMMDDGTEHLYIKEESVPNFKEFHARAALHDVFDRRKEETKKKAS
jgi:hypothetical protein